MVNLDVVKIKHYYSHVTVKRYHHGDLKNALIKAGIEILSRDGVRGLSLRKVALKAGVSHTAPYAHFADKQSLIAAISTEGFRIICENTARVIRRYKRKPVRQLIEASWAYIQFALSDSAHFKVTLSSVLEREKDYSEFVELSNKCFSQLVCIVESCQAAGLLRPGPSDVEAINVWSLVHGFASLLLEGQFYHKILERYTLRDLMISSLGHITLVELTPRTYAEIAASPRYAFPPVS
ncbi:MAG: TetR/AcrR family transcriptional regulator [Dehalococcoidia bacterium]|nr:TetR/AcrR family transcriptional regulator [Dehalococcoidia bacterium]